MNSITKKCTKCGETKEFSEFNKAKLGKDGLRSICRKCHNSDNKKWIKENRDKNNKAKRTYYYKHIKKVLAAAKDYIFRNKEFVSKKRREYNQNNRGKRLETERKYINEHPGYVTKKRHNRRAREKNSEGKITAKQWQDLCSFYGNQCLCCGRKEIKLTLDHVVPLKLGGKNIISNVQPLCLSCNSRKGARYIDYRVVVFNG